MQQVLRDGPGDLQASSAGGLDRIRVVLGLGADEPEVDEGQARITFRRFAEVADRRVTC
jgi:hypothetical protein